MADCNQALAIHQQYYLAMGAYGCIKYVLGDIQGTAADRSESIAINPEYAIA